MAESAAKSHSHKTDNTSTMETLEVHAKDFLIKWVLAPDNSVIDWQVKPLRKSVHFAIYRKNDLEDEEFTALPNNSSSTLTSTPSSSRLRSTSVSSVNRITESFYKTKSRLATLSNNINNGDLSLIKDYNKLISNELVHGKLNCAKLGVYAFIFDNSFSKTIGKKILFSNKIEIDDRQSDSGLGETESESNADYSIDGALNINKSSSNIMRPKNGELLQSVLLKKRRKRLQGFVKRYFILNLKYGTLSYFRVNDSKLRGQMPITQSIISANARSLEIIIDSGMEVWDLKALNQADFDIWIEAFNSVKSSYFGNFDSVDGIYPKKVVYEENGIMSKDVVQELDAIQSKLEELSRLGDSPLHLNIEALSNELGVLLTKVNGPVNSRNEVFSIFSNEFYDAKEYLDGPVVELADQEDEDVFEDDDISSNASDISSFESHKLEVIHEIDTFTETNDDDKDNSLYPLPLNPVKRQLVIPEWNIPPTSILSFFRKNVGKDMTSIAMPVDMNEPVTFLQKYSELLEYCDLIDNALEVNPNNPSGEKILRIAAFAVSGISSVRVKERNIRKPFNPLLGETFELVREDKGIRLIGEKVSHRPPVFAFFVEASKWTLSFSLSPSQKFWGKTAEVLNKGNMKLTIKATGEIYQWNQPTSMLKNIIAGEKYSEPTGTITIKGSNGEKAVVEFAKGGMFSGRSEELTITAFDSQKKQLPYSVVGTWTEALTLKTNTTERIIWESGELVPDSKKRFGFTRFASELVVVTDIEKGKLAPTDSRLRPDLQAYLKKDIATAEQLKCELEEEQRTRRKDMEVAKKQHQVMFFDHHGDTADVGEWTYRRGEKSYWNRRANGDWEGLLKLW